MAKVERDRYMRSLAKRYRSYGFEAHKGYGTRRHLNAIAELGPCHAHRMSFAPVKREAHRIQPQSPGAIGRWAESFAAAALEDRGMKIVGRNFRTRFGEVDLIAADGRYAVLRRGEGAEAIGVRHANRDGDGVQGATDNSGEPGISSAGWRALARLED